MGWSSQGPHKASHVSGGSDAFTSTDVLEAIVKRLQESGAATLLLGAIADGQALVRSGTSIIGAAAGGAGALSKVVEATQAAGTRTLSASVPGGTLAATGDTLFVLFGGNAGAAASTVELRFGGAGGDVVASIASSADDFFGWALIRRTGAAAQAFYAAVGMDSAVVDFEATVTATGTQTLANALDLYLDASAGAGADAIFIHAFKVPK